jgi:Zn-dependent protease
MFRFTLFSVPVSIHWMFWLIGALFGSSFAMDDFRVLLVWMIVWVLSFLVHEFGHAFAFKKYGARPEIVLYGMGGFAKAHGYFTKKQHIWISLAGPLAEIALGFLAWSLLRFTAGADPLVSKFLVMLGFICIFWGALNLVPILPLDGGQILRHWSGRERMTAKVGMVAAIIVAIAMFVLFKSIFAPIFFGYLAYQNYKVSQGAPAQFGF